MSDKICRVKIDGQEREYVQGTSFLEAAAQFQAQYPDDIVLAIFNNKLVELHKHIKTDGTLEFVTTAVTNGRKAYRRSMIMLMEKAIFNLYGTSVKLRVMHTLGQGQYCELEGERQVSQGLLEEIRTQMHKLADADIQIRKSTIHTDAAIAMFHDYGMEDKSRLSAGVPMSTCMIWMATKTIFMAIWYHLPGI